MTDPRKWTAIKPYPTKAKLKEVSHWILAPTRIQKQYTELTGIIGKPETEDRFSFEVLIGSTSMPEVAEKCLELAGKYDWQVSKANADAIIADYKQAYDDLKHLIPVVDKRITQEEHDARQAATLAAHDKRVRDQEEANKLGIANRKRLATIMPAGAKRVIFAEHDVSDVDLRTDYFSSHTDQYAIIGFAYSEREDFHAMRLAAVSFPPTAALGPDGPSGVEHRDNYSMGGGNYLKNGDKNCTGWRVRSHRMPLHDSLLNREIQFAYTPPPSSPAALAQSAGVSGITITHNREKDGIELRFPDKPSAEIRDQLKSHGWRWSRFGSCWYKRCNAAEWDFALSIAGNPSPQASTDQTPEPQQEASPGVDAAGLMDAAAPTEPADIWQEEELTHNA